MEHDPFDLVGDVLEGQFRVLEVAGQGDLTVVYRGHYVELDAPVAIKCLSLPPMLDEALAEPLRESFREASRLHYRLAQDNSNIARSLTTGITLAPRRGATVPYLVREWFEGESLRSDLRRRAELERKGRSIGDAIKLLEPAVEGIVYAQTQGVFHLSLNPSNLFVSRRDGKRTLKVLDFGVARTMNELGAAMAAGSMQSPSGGFRVLFPAYAAPEQMDPSVGPVGAATDVYSLALVLMEVLSDRRVMCGQERTAIVARVLDLSHRPTPRAHGLTVSRGIEAALEQAVSLAPETRQKNVATFWNEVRASYKAALRATKGSSSFPPLASDDDQSEAAALPPLQEYRRREATLMGLAPEPTPALVPTSALAPTPVPTPVLAPSLSESHTPAYSFAPPAVRSPRTSTSFLASLSRLPRLVLAAVIVVSICAVGVVVAVVVVTLRGPKTTSASAAAAPGTPEVSVSPAASSLPSDTAALAPSTGAFVAWDPGARFSPPAAKRALDAVSYDVQNCRKGKQGGTAVARVTFLNDGSVSHVSLGPPLRGTLTGACVVDVLSSAHAPPFVGKPGTLVYTFFVKE